LSAVHQQIDSGKALAEIGLSLPDRDRNWIPAGLSGDITAAYEEITHNQPAGALPHVWK
jgi:hypothetical protein